ncbi:MAG: zinc metallopeptidase, partial [Lachnospiraceae bacterium]|nr:zinc metallopeptidase [Lachnospiraceae bacterium]
MGSYFSFLLAILVCGVISALASARVHRAYDHYGKITTRYGLTGYDVADRLLRAGGVTDVEIGRVGGSLTDHYHPIQGKVNLSDTTYGEASVAAAAVAAHEVGHVMQNKGGYLFYRVRTALVPVVNFGSRLAMPLVL